MDTDAARLWNAKADEWDDYVGKHGDANRRFNSDPVLWRMLGDVKGLDVLDAGCGTGYLSAKLAKKGARVVSVDVASEMVRVASANLARYGLEPRQDDAQTLATVADASVDRVVSNYVIMDLPDHEAALRACARVLRPGGEAVLVFLHPCFAVPGGPDRSEEDVVTYSWESPYIERGSFREDWGPFTSEFLTYHRPLSDYWRAMLAAGFTVVDFDEPVVAKDRRDATPEQIERYRSAVFSVAFRVVKPA